MNEQFKSGYPSGLTVSAVQALLHYFWSPEPYGNLTSGDIDQLSLAGLINADFKLTERGRCYVEAIMELPLPIQEWKVPRWSLPHEPH